MKAAVDAPDADTTEPTKALRVTEDSVNIWIGPGTNFDIVKAVKKGVLLTPATTLGWAPILLGGEVCWISEKYTEVIL
jgi:uncharacterized protein YgiM (DUF1202 family)